MCVILVSEPASKKQKTKFTALELCGNKDRPHGTYFPSVIVLDACLIRSAVIGCHGPSEEIGCKTRMLAH